MNKSSSADMEDPSYLNGWTTHAGYYSTVERMTYPLAIELVEWVNSILPFSIPGASALDDGCGAGVLGSAIKRTCPTIPLLSTDVAEGMVSATRDRAKREHWGGKHEARVLDARDLDGIADASLTHPMSQYMISLAPEPDRIARELYRVLSPDGVLGLGTWGETGYTCFAGPWTVAARETVPDYESPPLMPARWVEELQVKDALQEAGFKDVQTRLKSVGWEWVSVETVMHYVFEEGNPGIEVYKKDWVEKWGGDLADLKPRFEKAVKEAYGEGKLALPVKAVLAVGKK